MQMAVPHRVYRQRPHRVSLEARFSRYCLDFDGSTQYVDCGRDDSINPPGDGTKIFLEAWARTEADDSATQDIVLSNHNYGMRFREDAFVFFLRFVTAGYKVKAHWRLPGEDFRYQWTCLQAKWESGDYMRLYMNGEQVDMHGPFTDVITTGITSFGNTRVGLWQAYSFYFLGKITDVAILFDAPSDAEIRRRFRRGYARRVDESRLNLRLEEGAGLTAKDTSGYGNDGDLLPAGDPPTWVKVQKGELRSSVM